MPAHPDASAAIFGAAILFSWISAAAVPLRIATLPGPCDVLIGYAATLGARQGLPIKLAPQSDVTTMNRAVADGAAQAGACENTQTLHEADSFSEKLAPAFYAVTLPIGIYSRHVHAVTQLRPGDTIVLPRSPVDRDRARVLLYNFGLLRAHEDDGLNPDFSNIVNPIGFKLEEVQPAALPARLADAGAVLLPYTIAVRAGLQPAKDSIGFEDGRSAYAGAVIVRTTDLKAPWVMTLKHLFQSRQMRQFIYDRYGDSVRSPW